MKRIPVTFVLHVRRNTSATAEYDGSKNLTYTLIYSYIYLWSLVGGKWSCIS